MTQEPGHPTDEEILLVLDGESARAAGRAVHAHLASCWVCRSRMGELEATIQDFVSHQRRALDPQLTSPGRPSALLRARLSEAAAQSAPVTPFWRLPMLARTFAVGGAAVLLLVLGSRLLGRQAVPPEAAVAASSDRTVPDRRLTPGATRPVARQDVCTMAHEEVVRDVPDDLRRRVFQEYGILSAHPEDYEVDYLIAPGLGGTDDIRNLWPEPFTPSAWNARRKDVLEERLHQLVCGGELDIATAQQAIASDWITAYGKYCSDHAIVQQPRARLQRPRQYATRRIAKTPTTA